MGDVISFRPKQTTKEFLDQYCEKNHITQKEALEIAIEKLRALEQNQPQQQITKQPDTSQSEPEEIKCINRIQHKEVSWCVYKPPRMLKLETLDICKVCKKRRLGLTETSMDTRPLINDPEASTKIKDPKRTGYKQAGMTYCNNDGIWVYPTKCELCKTKTYAKYNDCQKNRVHTER